MRNGTPCYWLVNTVLQPTLNINLSGFSNTYDSNAILTEPDQIASD